MRTKKPPPEERLMAGPCTPLEAASPRQTQSGASLPHRQPGKKSLDLELRDIPRRTASASTTTSGSRPAELPRALAKYPGEITALCFNPRSTPKQKTPDPEIGGGICQIRQGDSRRKSRPGLVNQCSPVRGAFPGFCFLTSEAGDRGEHGGEVYRVTRSSRLLSSRPLVQPPGFNHRVTTQEPGTGWPPWRNYLPPLHFPTPPHQSRVDRERGAAFE